MKNITLSADERLLEKAREKARREHRSFNDAFRAWLAEWTGSVDRVADYDSLMELLEVRESGGPYTRDEMNER